MPETTSAPEDGLTLTPHVCMAELLYANPVILTPGMRRTFVAALKASLGNITELRSDETTLHLAFEGYPIPYENGKSVPAQMLFVSGASPGMKPDPQKTAETLETSLGQTWNWPEAREAAAAAPHTLLVTDFLATGLEPRQRVELFARALYVAATHIPCAALHFPASSCLVDPEEFLANVPESEDWFPLHGLVNVRLFSVRGTESEVVMDTLGLNVFGLPDAQCHCAGADLDALGGWLYSLAAYIVEADSLIDDGDTIDAFDGTRMIARYGDSLVSPRRVVLDLQPVPEE